MSLAYTIPAGSTSIIWIDPVTGIYQDVDKTFYLNNGTPIDDYDPNTGAYSEGGSWYTFQGVPLLTYDKATGNYQEEAGDWYTMAGIPIDSNTKQPKSNNPVKGKALSKAPDHTMLYAGIAVGVAAIIIGTIVYIKTKK